MIRVMVHYTYDWWELEKITGSNMMQYCANHGYKFCNWITPPYEKYTGKEKLRLISEWMELGDVALIMDGDAMITNFHIKIEDFLDDEKDFYICEYPKNGINSGVFILRLTEWSKTFFNYLIKEIGKPDIHCEQDAINKYLIENPNHPKIKIVPQPAFNSIMYNLYDEYKGTDGGSNWKPGHFVLHVPAKPLEERISILKNTPIVK